LSRASTSEAVDETDDAPTLVPAATVTAAVSPPLTAVRRMRMVELGRAMLALDEDDDARDEELRDEDDERLEEEGRGTELLDDERGRDEEERIDEDERLDDDAGTRPGGVGMRRPSVTSVSIRPPMVRRAVPVSLGN
jgi:hypothetical protein